MTRPITSVTITIETTHAEFGHETNDDMNGVHDDHSITSGVVAVLRRYAERIDAHGVENFDYPGCPVIGLNGQTVGRIIIEREDNQP